MPLLQFLCHSPEARKRLEGYRARLYRLAYAWTHNRALAEDLAQETLMRAWRKRAQLRQAGAEKAWLFRILANCHADHLRRQREAEDIEAAGLVDGSNPEAENERHALVGRVRAAIAALPAAQRQIVTLVDLEGFSYADVAAIVGVPVGTVMSRLCRARKALRLALLERAEAEAAAAQAGLWRVK